MIQQQPPQRNWLKILGIVVAATVISTLLALWAVHAYLFPGSFKPVTLSASEEQVLESKLERLETIRRSPSLHKGRLRSGQDESLQPERYSESEENRQIILSERELNALLAKNTDLASKLTIDLSQDLASAKLLIPLDEEFPVLGGKTMKVTAGLELAYRGEKPVVVLRGISLWGVPIPNAWLGNMKNIDLVQEFGYQKGFWKAFADGIDEVEINEGQLRVRLKE
ncbi:MAG: arginine N-succinyltransferase [Desulfuromonadales bacterium]